jgi:hypothetical protein
MIQAVVTLVSEVQKHYIIFWNPSHSCVFWNVQIPYNSEMLISLF